MRTRLGFWFTIFIIAFIFSQCDFRKKQPTVDNINDQQSTEMDSDDMSTNKKYSEMILKLYFNNGSLPPEYHYSYEIVFFENGEAALKLQKGYDKNTAPYEEKRNYDKQQLNSVVKKLKKLSSKTREPLVGGKVRTITLYDEMGHGKVLNIFPKNEEDSSLYDRCVELYDPHFAERINLLTK